MGGGGVASSFYSSHFKSHSSTCVFVLGLCFCLVVFVSAYCLCVCVWVSRIPCWSDFQFLILIHHFVLQLCHIVFVVSICGSASFCVCVAL